MIDYFVAIYSLNIIGAAPFLVKLIEIFADLFFHCFWCHVGYKTDGKLSSNLRKKTICENRRRKKRFDATDDGRVALSYFATPYNENTYLFRDHSFGT